MGPQPSCLVLTLALFLPKGLQMINAMLVFLVWCTAVRDLNTLFIGDRYTQSCHVRGSLFSLRVIEKNATINECCA